MAKRKKYFKTKISSIVVAVIVAILGIFLSRSGINLDNRTGVNTGSPKQDTAKVTSRTKVNTDSEYQDLAKLNYDKDQELIVNNNNPNFSDADLSTADGSWQIYSNLDSLGRATVANALLNKDLMPTKERQRLTVNPTGYQHKYVNGDWLYNRSHLIGYQLTGQNNNLKNLMTGTRSLNSPGMNHYEMDIAYFLKNHPDQYVRYQVRPIFRGDELVARGVQMKAQSIGSNDIHLNVYIFNIEKGVTIDYSNGNSQNQ